MAEIPHPHTECTLTRQELFGGGLNIFDNCRFCERRGVICPVDEHASAPAPAPAPAAFGN